MKTHPANSHLTKDGAEIIDSTPVELPIGFETPEPIEFMIRRLVRDPAIQAELNGKDVETFLEADDFDIPEDDMPTSPHEDNYDPQHILAREQEVNSGAVLPLDRSVVEQARAIVAKHRADVERSKQPTPKPVVDVPASPAA